MTRKALDRLVRARDCQAAAAPVAALPLTLVTIGEAETTGDVAGLRPLHLQKHLQAADHLHVPDPGHILAATDLPLAVAVLTIADMALAVPTTPHNVATEPILAPTAAHTHLTGIPVVDTTDPAQGPVPGLPVVGAGPGGKKIT